MLYGSASQHPCPPLAGFITIAKIHFFFDLEVFFYFFVPTIANCYPA